MIYLIHKNDRYNLYEILDVRTGTTVELEEDRLKRLLNIEGNYLINGRIENGNIVGDYLRNVSENENRTHLYVHLCEYTNKRHVIHSFLKNYTSSIKVISDEEFKIIVDGGYCVNCENINGEYVSRYTIETDKGLIGNVEKEVEKYLAKSRVLGLNAYLDVIVIGEQIILNEMSALSNGTVIVPDYITSISSNSIGNVKNLKVGNNVRSIGSHSSIVDKDIDIDINNNIEYIYKDSIISMDPYVMYGVYKKLFNDKHNVVVINGEE